ncbi:PREDICTED: G-type lectin S-receptor-like serine/threonine-protein kinase At4g27290 [Theobroma cacao]|uniref:Receptor-like serine/threonine-protein kinase n=1 Tax=Theobroma cacao TaxID=3641 RepID=A0AB32WPC4_THECC|nr:PREDICTED: G-type lectin S-receptor-like serine/threonine-protein kinase At4g27290 [Theobroma cacao]
MKGFATLFCLSFFSISTAVDTLNVTQSIRDGETIVSVAGIYEIGFFSPGASRKRYLGIWYKKMSVQNVVWVANREVPLNDSSGVLKVTNQGILVLLNHDGGIVWSSNASKPVRSPVAQLLNSGNLIVKEKNDTNPENFLWQSFDYPCDTLLPGMKLGRNFKSGLDSYLSSWKSLDDPSRGNFTYRYEVGGFPELKLREGSIVRFRSGPWNGMRFSGTTGLKLNPIFTFGVVFNKREVYYSYKDRKESIPSRMVLTQNGLWQRLNWIDRKQSWDVYTTVQKDDCDNYAQCGANGSCNINDSPECSCLKGFVPKFPNQWNIKQWSDGCVRKTPLNCSTDGFIKYSGVKLPDSGKSWFNYSINLDGCKNLCKKDCSCTAYANLDIRGGWSGCLLWFVDLIDIRNFTENGQEIYIRMAASELGQTQSTKSNGKKRMRIAVMSVISAAVLIFGLALVMYCWRKTYRIMPGLLNFLHVISSNVKNLKEDLELPSFDLSTIACATDNFSPEKKLGEGGFGSVYKGVFKNGQEFAVKRLSKSSRQGLDEFKNEVIHTAKLKHRNLVTLLGCCIEADEKLLIYEFMPNKSLDFFIFDQCQSMSLDWPTRYHIINGIARGLLYLHQDSRQRIIHRDMKAGNVLLDNEMNPKISDFGLARGFGEKEARASTKKVIGTYGYMAPEYAINGVYSTKSDVFSFGVLVLEILSGKRNRGFCHPDHQHNLLGHAWRLFVEGKALELIASPIRETSNPCEVLRSIHVGLLCVQRSAQDRPNMSKVVLMLGTQGPLPQPTQPGFFTERDLVEPSSSSGHRKLVLSNDFTITEVEAR